MKKSVYILKRMASQLKHVTTQKVLALTITAQSKIGRPNRSSNFSSTHFVQFTSVAGLAEKTNGKGSCREVSQTRNPLKYNPQQQVDQLTDKAGQGPY